LESLKHNSRFYREALSTVGAGQNKIFSTKKNTRDWYKSVRTEGFFSPPHRKLRQTEKKCAEPFCEAQKITDSHHRLDARNVICVNFKSTTKRLCTQEISKKLFKHFMQSVKAFSRWSKIVFNTI
jgi:hypothetical protein